MQTVVMTFEEIKSTLLPGDGLIGVDVEITGDADPGEPMVRYYPDGSGYPGSPPSFDYVSVRVLRVWSDQIEYERKDMPSLFKLLDRLMDDQIMENLDRVEADALEILGEHERYDPY